MKTTNIATRGYVLFFLVLCIACTALVFSCSSSGTSDSGETGTSSIFVSDDASAGSLGMSLVSATLAVASTAGFTVTLRDVSGSAVPNVTISCDTESGLALIEPSTGQFLTDGSGSASGVYGCTAPGSFQIACRGPVGFGRRVFATVVCSGSIPTGFTGFEGAGGGGLGGGVGNNDDDANDDFNVRLTGIEVSDDGGTSTSTSVDVVQDICDVDATTGEITYEAFFDTLVTFSVENNSDEIVRFSSYSYTVFNYDLNGNRHTSPNLSFIGEAAAVSGGGGTGTFTALFADAASGVKTFFRRSSGIGQVGFLNIEFTLNGTTSGGDSVTVTGRTSLSFDNFNNC